VQVRDNTERSGAKLIDYNTTNGTWEFEVQHFSRYGMDDEEEDSSATATGTLPVRRASIPLMAGRPRTARVQASQPTSSTPSRFAMESDDEDSSPSPDAAQVDMDSAMDGLESAMDDEVGWAR